MIVYFLNNMIRSTNHEIVLNDIKTTKITEFSYF